MGGNIPGGDFPGGVWWVGIFLVGIFPGWIFLEPCRNAVSFTIAIIFFSLFFSTANLDALTKDAYQIFYIC